MTHVRQAAPAPRPWTVRARHWCAAALLLAGAGRAGAQVTPNADWRTFETPHFRVHFVPRTEEFARRAGASAERAYQQLARELVPPRGPIDLLVADDADFTNGFATPFPSNRIVIYAHPPVDLLALRNYDDWGTLVITHELTHIFHLDRARTGWRLLQRVFGRHPALFPAAYEPNWVTEGLAVYYETRLTGAGRLAGSEHRAVARAAAQSGRFPAVQDLNTLYARFPGGGVVYVYGSLLFDELARTTGADGVPRFIERSSGQLLPFALERTARKSFGVGFRKAWRSVRDSAFAAAGPLRPPIEGWRKFGPVFELLEYPRWRDSGVVVRASTGRETTGAYEILADGRTRRLGRRIGGDANVPLAGGGLLFAELQYDGPYAIRSDLYVERDGRRTRLTHGQRLAQPDARADGEIIAVRAEAGTTTLARVARGGGPARNIVATSPDTQWTEPRWSPRGDRIAAVRIIRGGRSEIAILDTNGITTAVVATEDGSVSGSPAWSSSGGQLFFASDRSGTREVYQLPVDSTPAAAVAPAPAPVRVSDAGTALLYPEPDPSGGQLAAVHLGGKGYQLGVAPLTSVVPAMADSVPRARSASAARRADGAARRYSAWRGLLPTYWEPYVEGTEVETRVGAATSGNDITGRHAYALFGYAGTRGVERGGFAAYEWAGLGRPVVALTVLQDWETVGTITDSADRFVDRLHRRTRYVNGALAWARPRVRNRLSMAAGARLEVRSYATEEPSTLGRINPFFSSTLRRPTIYGAMSASNTQRAARSISPEDGLAANALSEFSWQQGAEKSGHTRLSGGTAAFKSLDLPGFAHHVAMARVSGGWTNSRDGTELTVGGSGDDAFALPGSASAFGDRAFPVRGYISGALAGTRAVSATIEYRAPVLFASLGTRFLPVFFDRTSVRLFGDAATAWCPASVVAAARCGASPGSPLSSIGAEVLATGAFILEAPITLTVGYASPVGRIPQGTADRGVYLRLAY